MIHFMRSLRTLGFAAALVSGMCGGAAAQQQPLRIGFGMAQTGALAAMGKAALISMEIWRDDVNARGGLLGRKVEFVSYDDQTNPASVPPIYSKLLDVDKVDLVVSGYGTAVVAPAMPLIMQRNLTFMTLFGLNVNSKFNYDRYFSIIPAGPRPAMGWTAGFFDAAKSISPKPVTIAIAGSDAEYPHMALDAAREHAQNMGLKVVYDKTFPPTTTDYAPVLRAIQAVNPDIVFVATYPPESVGVIRAANEVGLKAKLFGGGMIGTQYVAIKTQLGPLMNGVVSVETFAPEIMDRLPSVSQFLVKYQARAVKEGVDPLGYYLPPYAYAQMQVLEQAINAVGSLDQAKLAEYMHKASFDTVVGKVSFSPNGEWTSSRVLYVQYSGVTGNDVEEWRKAGHETVLYPPDYKTGSLHYPYEAGKK